MDIRMGRAIGRCLYQIVLTYLIPLDSPAIWLRICESLYISFIINAVLFEV